MLRKSIICLYVAGIVLFSACGDQTPGNVVSPSVEKSSEQIRLEDWGPKEARVNSPFNVQANGKSGLWIKVSGFDVNKGVRVYLGEYLLEDIGFGNNTITAGLTNEMISKPGDLSLRVVENGTNREATIGIFSVH